MSVWQRRLLVVLLLSLNSLSTQATQIVIDNQDGANEGFNDNTTVTPAGGNPGITLGQQRLNVFEHAAKIWEAIVGSNITIVVSAQFDPLSCTSSQAILGSAGPTTIHQNFAPPNTITRNTWYPQSLANSLDNTDLDSGEPDISATFNADIDNNNNCLNNTNWYYGLDGNKPSGTIELLTVVMHEIGHGLGFLTFVNLSDGSMPSNTKDIYTLNLEDHSTGQTWDALTNAGRLASATDTADLHWLGSNVTALTGNYTSGVDQGHIRMNAPGTLSSGSSVSHFSTALSPNELMEPTDTGPKSSVGLALALMQDIGWPIFSDAFPVLAILGDENASQGGTTPITVLIQDNDTPLASLNLTATSSNTVLIAPSGLVFSGSGSERTLSITPETGTAGGNVTIDVTLADATNNTVESFIVNITANTPPAVTITTPANNTEVLDTDLVTLQANATDTEDGDISASLTWVSSVDGTVGNGNGANTLLTEGVHTLTATAIDSSGAPGDAFVTITSYGSGDSDSDTLADNWEFMHFSSLAQTAAGDFDNDNLSNAEEFSLGTDPTDDDTDNDGFTDDIEVTAGSDPLDSDSVPVTPGDINTDGSVNTIDVLLALRFIFGLNTPTTAESQAMDVAPLVAGVPTPDGSLTLGDALVIQRRALNLIVF